MATKYHLQVTGVDVDPDQIREAEKRSAEITNARFYLLDGTQLPFKDGEFDLVATNKVMHHIPGWQSAFAEMVRVLKPNGFLTYSDLIFPNWLAAIGKTLAGGRARFPTKTAVERLVETHHLRRIHYSPALEYHSS